MPAAAAGTSRDASSIHLRPVDLDHWSEIRALHAASLRHTLAALVGSDQLPAIVAEVYEPDYTDRLMTYDLQTAWIGSILVGTSGWHPASDHGRSARIVSVHVAPLHARLGIGRRLVAVTENRARSAGFEAITARVLPQSVGFFEALGYRRSSQGLQSVGTEHGLPAVYLRKALDERRHADATRIGDAPLPNDGVV